MAGWPSVWQRIARTLAEVQMQGWQQVSNKGMQCWQQGCKKWLPGCQITAIRLEEKLCEAINDKAGSIALMQVGSGS